MSCCSLVESVYFTARCQSPVTLQVELRQETHHRPMDLRAARPQACSAPRGAGHGEPGQQEQEWEVALKIASSIAAEARAAVKVHGLLF